MPEVPVAGVQALSALLEIKEAMNKYKIGWRKIFSVSAFGFGSDAVNH